MNRRVTSNSRMLAFIAWCERLVSCYRERLTDAEREALDEWESRPDFPKIGEWPGGSPTSGSAQRWIPQLRFSSAGGTHELPGAHFRGWSASRDGGRKIFSPRAGTRTQSSNWKMRHFGKRHLATCVPVPASRQKSCTQPDRTGSPPMRERQKLCLAEPLAVSGFLLHPNPNW